MTKKIHKLRFDDVDIFLLGISSHENDYRITWAINEALEIHLTHQEDIVAQNKKHSETQEFTVYSTFDEISLSKYHIIKNTCENGFFLEKLKNFDFIMQISGANIDSKIKEIIKKVNEASIVTAVMTIDIEKTVPKDKLNILKDLTLI